MNPYKLDVKQYSKLARQAAAEGCVLLKNEGGTLPFRSNDKIALFGRIAFDYYKSGLGSGGLVNTPYVVGILEALRNEKEYYLDEEVLAVYEAWIKDHPFDHGSGWGKTPWSQEEMPVSDELIEKAKKNDIAVVIIGRTAGEDQDTKYEEGSYLLTKIEEDLLAKVCKAFDKVVVILNVGNLIDMHWALEYKPSAILYAWQGGQEGGNGVVDILSGRVCPSGKLSDTIAYTLEDYPSHPNFGDLLKNVYQEDIYVGYRYFETFAKERVMYPFGYGLSYTAFERKCTSYHETKDATYLEVLIDNIGSVAGKEVIQVYVEAPQGMLGKASRSLVAFSKTEILQPKDKTTLTIRIPIEAMASYDDSGITGCKSAFVLEEGEYRFYVGGDVRSAQYVGSRVLASLVVVEQLEEACAPTEIFDRYRPSSDENGGYRLVMEKAPTRTVSPDAKRIKNIDFPCTGDRGIRLHDVFDGKHQLDAFVAQLSNEDLIHMFRGEGMCSPKVTPGTAGAFGGVTEQLRHLGIPVACCADGPSGIRMDCGTKAFSLPNGTALGCSFNYELVEELYAMTGKELRKNKIDTLLGPGMNIHRHPLNGRNFEYISEDPLLTGKMSAAQVAGMGAAGVTGTIKHFCANNQEAARRFTDSVVSERALREIYLKGFEIAVKEGGAGAVMTSYGAVNGIWTAGNYDLCTTILRKEWKFDGVVMTDWWAEANIEGQVSTKENKASMVAAQNDVYMCVVDSISNPEKDDVASRLEAGDITRYELARNAMNILQFIMRSPVMLHEMGRISAEELEDMKDQENDEFQAEDIEFYAPTDHEFDIVIDGTALNTERGKSVIFGLAFSKIGYYEVRIRMKSELGVLAQLPVSIYYDNVLQSTITIQGTEGKWVNEVRPIGVIFGFHHYLKLYFGASGLDIDEIRLRYVEGDEAK